MQGVEKLKRRDRLTVSLLFNKIRKVYEFEIGEEFLPAFQKALLDYFDKKDINLFFKIEELK